MRMSSGERKMLNGRMPRRNAPMNRAPLSIVGTRKGLENFSRKTKQGRRVEAAQTQ
jgi:hypothetical protein